MTALARLITGARRPRARSRLVLAFALVAIAVWQASFGMVAPAKFDASHRVLASTGIQAESRFFFFLYHLGLYPIAPTTPPQADTRGEAERLLRDEPRSLVQEIGLTFASGERGRAYLYYVDALLRGDRSSPRLRPASALAFTLALEALFFAFWWARRPAAGAVLVTILGSSPFQLDAIHGQDNVFSWPLTTMIFLLALHVPLLGDWRAHGKKSAHLVLGIAVATGLLVATMRQIRSEPTTMLASAFLVYATLRGASLRERLAPIALSLVVCLAASAGYRAVFQAKLERAKTALSAAGGVPYEGPVEFHHELWHPVFCGLGDFDTTHGYAWDDRVAYAYALRVAEARAGKKLGLNPTFWAQKRSYDGAGRYPVPFYEEIPGYHQIMRDKVLSDIAREPRWYATILGKRLGRILFETTPIALSAGALSVGFSASWIGPACALLLGVLALARRWADVKLLLFATPLSATALLIFSGRGMTSYSAYHLVGAAVLASLAAEGLARWLRSGGLPG